MFFHGRFLGWLLWGVLVALLVPVSPASAGTLLVGGAWSGPNHYEHLQDALDAALPGDDIWIAGGTYYPDEGASVVDGDRAATFVIRNGINLYGGFQGNETSFSERPTGPPFPFTTTLSGDLDQDDASGGGVGDNSRHVVTYVFVAPGASPLLDRLVIRAGNADGAGPEGQGAAVQVRDASKCIPGGPVLVDCVIEDNHSDHHGAVNDHGDATQIIGCTFRNNTAGTGGALQIEHGNTVVTNTVFENNVAVTEGGAVWISADPEDPSCDDTPGQFGEPVFSGCLFRNNTGGEGGAVYIIDANPRFVDCDLEDNVGGLGGGIWAQNSDARFEDCRFFRNEAEDSYAGGAFFGGGSALLSGCRFLENTAKVGGGAVYNSGGAATLVVDCSFEKNSAEGGILEVGGAIIDQNSGSPGCRYASCRFIENHAAGEAGAVWIDSGDSHFENCLFARNTSESFGAAISKNLDGSPSIESCTFVENASDLGESGGLSISNFGFADPVQIRNSIFWNNVGPDADDQILVHDGIGPDVEWTLVQGGWPGATNLDVDPLFVTGPGGRYYLSRIAAGDALDSPGIDAGDGLAADTLSLDRRTTRRDFVGDRNTVDLGFHYPSVLASGSRYLNVVVPPVTDSQGQEIDIALSVRSMHDHPCLLAYVDASGATTPGPVFQPPSDWTDVHVHGLEVAPDTRYEVYYEVQGEEPVEIGRDRTGLWGDADRDGMVSFIDILAAVQAFQGVPTVSRFDTDLVGSDPGASPFLPDGMVDFLDISSCVQAFTGLPYGGPAPCGAVPSQWVVVEETGASLVLVPSAASIAPGGWVDVDAYLENSASSVQSYQIELEVTGGISGSLNLDEINVDTNRPDYLLFGEGSVVAIDEPDSRLANVHDGAGVAAGSSSYLGTFRLRASFNARGSFSVGFRIDETGLKDPADRLIEVGALTGTSVSVQTRGGGGGPN